MKLICVNRFFQPKRVHAFHAAMFHGVSEILRAADRYSHFAGDDLTEPLRVRRSGRNIPDFFAPGNSFVVSTAVRDALGHLSSVQYGPVEFTKLVDLEYRPGDFDYQPVLQRRYGIENSPDVDCLYDLLPDVPELHEGVGRYYEVVVPRLRDIISRYDTLRTVKCMPWTIIGEIELTLSDRLCTDNPVFWHFSSFIAERVYERVSSFIDCDYFETRIVDV